MSKLERILCTGSTELPDCVCGQEMALSSTQPSAQDDLGSELRTYSCPACGHELRLTVWTEPGRTGDALISL